MPPQQEQSSAALLSQLGALTAIAGVGSNLGLKNPADLYIAILQTNLVADSIVDRFHLEDVYHIPDRDAAAGRLRKRSKFVANKTGLIQVTVEDGDPNRAVALVNGYSDELVQQNNRLAIGAASQRRQFYEQQLAQEKDRLADAEVALTKTQLSTGVLQVSGQAQNIIGEEANLQANITAHEVQLGALLASSTEQNPDVVRLRTELAALREQLNKEQHGTSGAMLSPVVDTATPGTVSHFTINPRPGDDQPIRNLPEDATEPAVERHLGALHDAVDAVAEMAFGPVTVTAETRLHGGGTFKQTATIDYGLQS